MSEKEHVDHPQHYGGADNPHECIKVIEAVLGKAGYAIWLRGELLKYTFRIGEKGEPKTDAGKLRFYATELERVHKEFAAAWNTPPSGTAEFMKKWGMRHEGQGVGADRGGEAPGDDGPADGGKSDPVRDGRAAAGSGGYDGGDQQRGAPGDGGRADGRTAEPDDPAARDSLIAAEYEALVSRKRK